MIGRQHFIGQLVSSLDNINLKNMIYIICLIGLYCYQLYNNYMSCIRFYNNISNINKQLCEMKSYLHYSITRMNLFLKIIENKTHYIGFYNDLLHHKNQLHNLNQLISPICDFNPSFSKINEIPINPTGK